MTPEPQAEMTREQSALLGYMEHASEERWCAGWLTSLHTALVGDEAYEWLVEAAGGWFASAGEDRGEAKNYNGRDLVFVNGALRELREKVVTRDDHFTLVRAGQIARQFHETYERLAPEHSYETRKESAVEWENVPQNNKALMTAVVFELMKRKVIV